MSKSYDVKMAQWRRRRQKIASLYRSGKGPTAIAKLLRISKQRVNFIFQDMKSRGEI